MSESNERVEHDEIGVVRVYKRSTACESKYIHSRVFYVRRVPYFMNVGDDVARTGLLELWLVVVATADVLAEL